MAAGCLEERPRPAPPLVSFQVDAPTVCSPDTVSGDLRAEDPDGIDSLWITVDGQVEGIDGLLEPVLESSFKLLIRPGLGVGSSVLVLIRARDLTGFTDTTSRSLPVILCTATT